MRDDAVLRRALPLGRGLGRLALRLGPIGFYAVVVNKLEDMMTVDQNGTRWKTYRPQQ